MRLTWYLLFVLVATPIDIWLDIFAGLRIAGRTELLIRPFAQAAFYLYACAISAEVVFRISNLSNHIDVGKPLRLFQIAAALLIVYFVGDYVQIQRPVINNGGTVEGTMYSQLGMAFVAILISWMAYWLEGRRRSYLEKFMN